MKQMVQKLQKTLGVKFVSTGKVVSESDLEAAVNDGNYSVAFYPFKAKSSFAGESIEGFDQNNIFGYESDVLSQKIRNIKNNSGSLEMCIRDSVYVDETHKNDSLNYLKDISL